MWRHTLPLLCLVLKYNPWIVVLSWDSCVTKGWPFVKLIFVKRLHFFTILFCHVLCQFANSCCHRVAKCDVTKIKICEFMGFVEIIWEIKTKYVSLLKIRMLMQIVSDLLPQLCSDDSTQILLKMAWFLMLGTKPIFIRICMRSSEQNRGNISSLIGGKMVNFGMEAFFILIFPNITSKLVISQINELFVTSSLRYSSYDEEFYFAFYKNSSKLIVRLFIKLLIKIECNSLI